MYNYRSTDPNTQIGYLLAMVNGDVNNRIPEWAKSLCRWDHFVYASCLLLWQALFVHEEQLFQQADHCQGAP